jgi:hypothetical protein
MLDLLLRRLDQDPRHADIRVLGRRPIEERGFADWSMANATITPQQGAELRELMADASPSAARVVRLLKSALAKAPTID